LIHFLACASFLAFIIRNTGSELITQFTNTKESNMATVLDYLEEETKFIPDPDIPKELASAPLLSAVEAVVTFEVEVLNEEDGDYDLVEGSIPALEVTAGDDTNQTTFVLVSPNSEEWLYYQTVEQFISETYPDDDISYTYEILSDEVF
jgi:hypothetical protein